jgi:hypothetical protein
LLKNALSTDCLRLNDKDWGHCDVKGDENLKRNNGVDED